MIFLYDHIDYKKFLQDIADRFSGTFDGVTMNFPPNIADGNNRLINLAEGLQAILYNYTLNAEFTYFRTTSFPEIFTFRVE